ncbi:unnamed protein product [Anisakis simplex]|uniref:Protein lethal(2)essential for life (inferred by orthology to a D. melanogaster protein) n=1 Tax=Anisakis simplex TaxID=6269 RepID=A0A0M3K9A3_ANISI|nr:unnamed protein product [Anisakis simplex]
MSLTPWCMTPMDRMFREMERSFDAFRPYWTDQPMMRQANLENAVGNIVNDRDKFSIEMDVSQFAPEELKVEVRDKDLIVEGHHEERSDEHGSIKRHFVRKFTLPDSVDVQAINSRLSDTGVLTVIAPKISTALPPTRSIPIEHAPRASIQRR